MKRAEIVHYISTKAYGEQLDPPITARRVRVLCAEGRLDCWKMGNMWLIHKDAPDPRRKHVRLNAKANN